MVELVRSKLRKSQRVTIGCLCVMDVHGRDVLKTMIKQNICDINNFDWKKQLRYYWETEEDNIFLKQTNTRFQYGYEYLGN